MKIQLSIMNKGGDQTLDHDLNFAEDRYESTHKVVRLILRILMHMSQSYSSQTFKNPKGELLERLRDSGPVPGDENGAKPTKDPLKKKSRANKNVSIISLFLPISILRLR